MPAGFGEAPGLLALATLFPALAHHRTAGPARGKLLPAGNSWDRNPFFRASQRLSAASTLPRAVARFIAATGVY